MQHMMANQGPAELDPVARRKLVKDIRDEIKPLIAQIADFQIEKANQVIKVQIRKIENEMVYRTANTSVSFLILINVVGG